MRDAIRVCYGMCRPGSGTGVLEVEECEVKHDGEHQQPRRDRGNLALMRKSYPLLHSESVSYRSTGYYRGLIV